MTNGPNETVVTGSAMPNARISAAINGAMVMLMISNQKLVEKGLAKPMTTEAAQGEAMRQVRSQLPRRPMVRDWSTDRRTKNADAAYRKVGSAVLS